MGPHRADLTLQVQDRRAKHRVSRGQQKMLGATLVIAQTRFVAEQSQVPRLLKISGQDAESPPGDVVESRYGTDVTPPAVAQAAGLHC